MARVVDKVVQKRIPMYQVKSKVLEAIVAGHRVPRRDLLGPRLNNMSLEDFALSPEESRQSKETEELPQVIEYVNHHNLEKVARRALGAAR